MDTVSEIADPFVPDRAGAGDDAAETGRHDNPGAARNVVNILIKRT